MMSPEEVKKGPVPPKIRRKAAGETRGKTTVQPLLELGPAETENVGEKLREYYQSFLKENNVSLEAPLLENFRIGTVETRAAHKAYVKDRENDHAFRQTEIGHALERMVQAEVLKSGWFGGAIHVPATKYDDFKNGTDAVLEWRDTDAHLALDMTANPDPGMLKKKLEEWKRATEITYFRSSALKDAKGKPFETSLVAVPRVVLGLDGAFMQRVLKEKDKRKDWVELIFLAEMISQLLKTQKDWIGSSNQKQKRVAEQAEALLNVLVPVYKNALPSDKLRAAQAPQSSMFQRLALGWETLA